MSTNLSAEESESHEEESFWPRSPFILAFPVKKENMSRVMRVTLFKRRTQADKKNEFEKLRTGMEPGRLRLKNSEVA